MRLSEAQKQVLAAVQLQADVGIPSIARETGLREHTVRYALSELHRFGFVTPFPIVNIHALGYTDYCVFLSLSGEQQGFRAKLLKHLVGAAHTAWVAELAGEYHYTVSLFARRISEVYRYFEEMSRAVPGLVLDKAFATRLSWTSFRCRHLCNRPSAVEQITRTERDLVVQIDGCDDRILRELARDPLAARSQLAKKCDLAPSTFDRRLKNLRDRGVLLGVALYAEVNKIGLHAFRFLICTKAASEELTRRLYDFAFRETRVTGFIHCIGQWDYEMNVEVESPPDLGIVLDRLYTEFSGALRSVKTVTVLATPKTNPYPFVASSYSDRPSW